MRRLKDYTPHKPTKISERSAKDIKYGILDKDHKEQIEEGLEMLNERIFKCHSCGHRTKTIARVMAIPEMICCSCDKDMEQEVKSSPPALKFNGSGWTEKGKGK